MGGFTTQRSTLRCAPAGRENTSRSSTCSCPRCCNRSRVSKRESGWAACLRYRGARQGLAARLIREFDKLNSTSLRPPPCSTCGCRKTHFAGQSKGGIPNFSCETCKKKFSRRSGTPFVNTKTDCHCQGRRHTRRNAVQAAIPRDGFINAVECTSTCSDKLCSSQVYGKLCKYWHAFQRVCDDVGNAATGTRILNGSAASPSATSPRRPVRGSRSTYVHGASPLASRTKPKSLRIRCNGTARRSTVPLPFLAPAARRQSISFSTAASPSESPDPVVVGKHQHWYR